MEATLLLFLLHSATLHLAHILFLLLLLSLSDDLDVFSLSFLGGCFVMFAVVAEAERATFPSGSSVLVLRFHWLRGT